MRKPTFGRTVSFEAISRYWSTSNGFSITTITCFPRRTAIEAVER